MSHRTTPPLDGKRLQLAPERGGEGGEGDGARDDGARDGDSRATHAAEPLPPPIAPPRGTTWWRRLFFDDNQRTSGWLSSMLFHTTILLLLALTVRPYVAPRGGPELTSLLSDDVPAIDEAPSVTGELDDPSPVVTAESTALEMPVTEIQLDVPPAEAADEPVVDDATDPSDNAASDDSGADVSFLLAGRSADARAELVRRRGGTPGSEAAVERGLQWIAAHQLADGGWNFNHNLSRCAGQCRNPGSVPTTTGATAVALLAFLGAGHTHLDGDYAEVVRRGLYYLAKHASDTPQGADLQEGTMYAQALSTIALCEASAMTGDKSLAELAQQAIDFVAYAQDDSGGGWRYFPNSIGDTSVTGWQLMALKSGQIAGLEVRRSCFYGASHFLDTVSAENGVRYRYQSADDDSASMTSVGLLCRMYLDWKRDDPRLRAGVEYLSELGPSDRDMYFNYYATQVLSHYGGPMWEAWNPTMRDFLVTTQATEGHESGSWFFVEKHATGAGRLYNTAISVMILEVYYRHMPLYGDQAVGD
jgi:hypothetical protein